MPRTVWNTFTGFNENLKIATQVNARHTFFKPKNDSLAISALSATLRDLL